MPAGATGYGFRQGKTLSPAKLRVAVKGIKKLIHIIAHDIMQKMKKIELICVGDLKYKELKGLEKKFVQRINFFTTFTVRNTKEIKSKDDRLKKEKEGQMILELLDKRDLVIALDQYGKKMDSIGFSSFLSEKISHHPGRIVFLIGGHSGLSKSLDSRIDNKISFSDMTFAHDIFRILFLEQLYRGFTILKGIKYHR